MKIKTKKQLNLPQLIEWAMDNEIKDRMFLSGCYCVGFDRHGYIHFNSSTTIPLDTMFTVEVEETVTEDTVIPELVMYCKSYYSDSELINGIYKNKNINSFVNHSTSLAPISFYILNDDLTMTLFWRDGKLVE